MIGWIGAVAFGICGLPQAAKACRDGHAEGLSLSFLVLWTIGEVFTFAAVLMDAPRAYLIANYLLNGLFLAVLWKYRLWPRRVA
jgi:uncharacterized protein with PQ loop repeat